MATEDSMTDNDRAEVSGMHADLTDTPVGRAFAERFGADQAEALAAAAMQHADDEMHANHGSDPFRWVIAITIGYECFTRFGKHHGVTAPGDDIVAWIKSDGGLSRHDGDIDYLSLFSGVYEQYVPQADTPDAQVTA